jgi:hypothetical protein
MLVNYWDHNKRITRIWFAGDFRLWTSRLTPAECDAIRDEINRLIDANVAEGKPIVTTSWMPGSHWPAGTPFHPIWAKATRKSEVQAAMCFGLFCQEVIMARPETWTSEHFEKDGKPIPGRTYFQVHPIAKAS